MSWPSCSGTRSGHHIARHIPQQRASAAEGARVFGEIAMAGGGNARDVRRAAELGATVGARTYSRTPNWRPTPSARPSPIARGTIRSQGAQLFMRLPDPGHAFLSTHPPNAERIRVVRRAVAALRGSGVP
jgi:hypothetical protein